MMSMRIPTPAPSIVQRATIDQRRPGLTRRPRRRRFASERRTASVPSSAPIPAVWVMNARSGTGAMVVLAKNPPIAALSRVSEWLGAHCGGPLAVVALSGAAVPGQSVEAEGRAA
jgi:hypothetical protein